MARCTLTISGQTYNLGRTPIPEGTYPSTKGSACVENAIWDRTGGRWTYDLRRGTTISDNISILLNSPAGTTLRCGSSTIIIDSRIYSPYQPNDILMYGRVSIRGGEYVQWGLPGYSNLGMYMGGEADVTDFKLPDSQYSESTSYYGRVVHGCHIYTQLRSATQIRLGYPTRTIIPDKGTHPSSLDWRGVYLAGNGYGGTITKNIYDFTLIDGEWVADNPDLSGVDAMFPLMKALAGGLRVVGYTDPYVGGGTSDTGGGEGSFDNSSTPIDTPSAPSISASSTGFVTLYNPTLSQVQSLCSYMWSDLFEVNSFKKLFADPMDAILGLSIVPVPVPDGGAQQVLVGNVPTGLTMTKAGAQYVTVNCGNVDIDEYWGAYMDYEPYTKIELYLPFIGTKPISADDVMGKTVNLTYLVDILTGTCVAFLKCGDAILYQFNGQCACQIPITSNDWRGVITGAISMAAGIGSMIATGGATAPLVAPTLASTAINSMKPQVEKSGNLSGAASVMCLTTPYFIITRPRQALPKDQNKFIGYPSYVTMQLSDMEGFAAVETIHLENMTATEPEVAEIETLLKEGVIL